MKELKLAYEDKFVLVDDEDFERLSAFTWCLSNRDRSPVIRRWTTVNRKTVGTPIANQVLMEFDITVDHIDGNPFNNQKSNLRYCTPGENATNRTKKTPFCSSKYKGVYWCEPRKKWIAQIKYNKKAKNLGGFDTQEEAALVYNEQAKILFGEFAALNNVVQPAEITLTN